jgi:hypothetical protein
MMEVERRQAPRAKFKGITLVRSNGNELPCVAGDLSESGMMLYPQIRQHPSLGTALKLTFTLPKSPSWIEVEGKLVREGRHKARCVWGIQFDSLSEQVREILRNYVHDHRQPVASMPKPVRLEVPPPQSVPVAQSERVTAPMRAVTASIPRIRVEETREVPMEEIAALTTEGPTRQVTIDQILEVETANEETQHGKKAELAALQERCRKN